ncbi:hypothetical protein M8J76_003634 [Diaphorina citri]|nr:hypothetical protein M8J75_012796 [Diaphorina citri]KAI5723270.1 hypothetical protein M8J76_003634 [Diaphorina citri]
MDVFLPASIKHKVVSLKLTSTVTLPASLKTQSITRVNQALIMTVSLKLIVLTSVRSHLRHTVPTVTNTRLRNNSNAEVTDTVPRRNSFSDTNTSVTPLKPGIT